ncbi:MAG: NUDIX domain-containing protein, partial [Proteobacteria bacterium]|nr:NUDIX domain-containing protein [Pseudomonadota bacterium]
GIVEEGETAEEVVCREAQEEAGCEILQLEPIAKYFSTPGACTELVSLFCGRIDSTGLGGIHGLETENEDICATVWSLEDALSALRNGAICNSMTLIALQWLSGQHGRITEEWLG